AKEIGLTNSHWHTVHGGNRCDFRIGCVPECTLQKCGLANPVCTFGNLCPPQYGTTVHDLAKLWHALAKESPSIISMMGSRASNLVRAGSIFTSNYYNSYKHWITYFPGVDAEKNGGTNNDPKSCFTKPVGGGSAPCWIAQATRAGQPLIAAVLQS